jgi:hypothetical protein
MLVLTGCPFLSLLVRQIEDILPLVSLMRRRLLSAPDLSVDGVDDQQGESHHEYRDRYRDKR